MEDALTLLNDSQDDNRPASRIRYEEDVYGWALEQASLLRAGLFSELDVVNLVDEVSDAARREDHELENRLSVVLQHLLIGDHQKNRRSASGARTIREQRRQVGRLLRDSPSLTSRLDTLVSEAYAQGRVAALNETKLPEGAMPETIPIPGIRS